MRDEDVVDLRQLGERQVADAGAGVDQDVVVEQERGGAKVAAAYATGAAEHAQAHGYFSSNTVTGSQSAVIGVARARVIFSAYTRYSMTCGASRCKLTRFISARSQLRER